MMPSSHLPLITLRSAASQLPDAGLTTRELFWRMVALILYWAALILLPFLMLAAPMLARAEDGTFRVALHDAEQAVAQTLQEEGVAPKVRVSLQSQGLRVPLATYEREIKVYVQRLQLDKDRAKLEATLVFEADGKPLPPLQVTGRYEGMQPLPVLNRAVRNGQVIAEDDITLRDVATTRIRKNTVTDKTQLVGKTAIRTISPNRMVRLDELSAPAVLTKGSPVTIRYIAQGLEIKALGEAQDHGAVGDMVRVRNQDSKQIVQGLVQDTHTVVIYGAGASPVTAAAAIAAPANTAASPADVALPATLGTPALVKQAQPKTSAGFPGQPITLGKAATSAGLPTLPTSIPNQDMKQSGDNEVGDAPVGALTDPIDVLEKNHAQ